MSKSRPPQWLEAYAPVAEAIVRLFHPYVEVAIHDLATDRTVALWNPSSGRKVGDPALLAELPGNIADLGVYGPYAKVLPDGRNLTSVSVVLADGQGVRRGLLCINFDHSPLDGAAELLARFAAPTAPRPPELFSCDWREQIALMVDEECRVRQLRRDRLSREEKLSLLKVLGDKGLFSTRKAASHAAASLGVSRATIYAMLKEVNR